MTFLMTDDANASWSAPEPEDSAGNLPGRKVISCANPKP